MTFAFRLFPIFTCFALLSSLALAQQKGGDFKKFNPRFEVFELPGGVLGNSVQGIVQDPAGFLWFASQEGLHRYDGQTFFTYRYDPLDDNSLASDYCEYIFLDSRGVLWLAHYNRGGLTAFDPARETFTRYRHDLNNPETLSSSTNSVIAEDREGNIWVGGDGGVDRLERKTGKSKRFGHNPADPRSLSYGQVRGLYVDKQGTVWVGTGFTWDAADPQRKLGGLNRYDPKTETFTRYLHDPNDPTTLAHNQVRAMLEDSRGNFWVGTGGEGLHRMDRETGKFTRLSYDPTNPAEMGSSVWRGLPLTSKPAESHVSSIFEDRDGRIWITEVMGGLNVHDPRGFGAGSASGTVRHFEAAPGAGNLTTNFLWHTFQSDDGVIWMATGNGGGTVYKVKEQGERLPYFLPDLGVGGVRVGDVVKDKAGNIWIGYVNISAFPLVRYDRKSGKSFPVPSSNDVPGGLNAQSINTLLPDREGFLWVGTDNGLYRYDPRYGKFKHFPHPLLNSFWVGHLLQDRNGYIWTGNWQIGLNRLDPKTGVYTTFRHDPTVPGSIGGTAISGLYEDAQGALWVGGGNGNDLKFPFFFDRFNPTDGQGSFTHFIKEKEAGMAECLTADDEGNIWFLGFGGIQKLNPSTGVRQKINASNSNLLSRALTSMARAKNGKFWLNANDGFIYELDPKTADFRAYGKQHGVPTGAHEFSEVFVADDGEVLIGRAGGFLAFYPDSIHWEENSRPPIVGITDFRLLEERITPGSGSVLKKPIWQMTDLRLAHDQNVFSFSVACFDFADPAANQLQFMLEGYDQGWRKDLRDGETPSYVNVPPGEYTFRVRGANSLGTWNMAGTSLRITISPPWWKTGWAYAFYGLFLIAGLFFANRFLRERIAEKERAKSRELELAQAQEIEKAYHELKATQAQLEVRNRDLEIEAALERVRGRTMAMQHSNQLREIAATTLEQLQSLGFTFGACSIVIMDAVSGDMIWWISGFEKDYPASYHIPYFEHPFYLAQLNNWKEGKKYAIMEVSGEDKKSYDKIIFSKTEFVKIPDELQKIMQAFEKITFSNAYMQHGALSWSTEPLGDEHATILQRFAGVFEQSYTRFLDLQKAEAQAREGQIELALERVRNRTMAMQNSDDVTTAIATMFTELEKLGVENLRCGIANINPNKTMGVWSVSNVENLKSAKGAGIFDMNAHILWQHLFKGWDEKEEFLYYYLADKEKEDYVKVLNATPNYLPQAIQQFPDMSFQAYYYSKGAIWTFSLQPHSETDKQLMHRFTSVFSLTFRRYQDLQKAEAQAREAQIEVGLERVRSKTMAMHQSNNLLNVITVVGIELHQIGIQFDWVNILTDVVKKEGLTAWQTVIGLQEPLNVYIPYLDHILFNAIEELSTNNIELWNYSLDENELRLWFEHVFSKTTFKNLPDELKQKRLNAKSCDISVVALKNNVFLSLAIHDGVSYTEEQNNIIKRFGKVFEQAYTRFLDLQKAEAQAVDLVREKQHLEKTLTELRATQSQLIQSEKLASLGELTAGIAHEIQNPLNFVNNFSELSVDLAKELNEELEKDSIDKGFVKELMGDLTSNQEKINHHGKRAAAIVTGMLQHARTSTGTKEPTDLNALADEYLRLSYHGLRAKDSSFNAKMVTDFDPSIGKVEVVPQDIGRVFLNIINNAFYATQQRRKDLTNFQNLSNLGTYEPTVSISSKRTAGAVEFRIKDNGSGIPDDVKARIFQPFFTTKPTGQGTGLGLSLAYDIVVKGHGGTVEVESTEGEGTQFVIQLPSPVNPR